MRFLGQGAEAVVRDIELEGILTKEYKELYKRSCLEARWQSGRGGRAHLSGLCRQPKGTMESEDSL